MVFMFRSLRVSWPRQPAKWPEQYNNKNHRDHGQGERNRYNGLSTHNLASQYCGRFTSSGSLAMFAAMRRALRCRISFARTYALPPACAWIKSGPFSQQVILEKRIFPRASEAGRRMRDRFFDGQRSSVRLGQ
jgi:hypothetical protein